MSVICFGELIIDFTSLELGIELSQARKFRKNVGGAPANVGVGLHHHGILVRLWSRVGDDSLGNFLIHQIREFGINTQDIIRDPIHPTKLALVGVDKSGERHFEFHNRDSADKYMRSEDYDLEEFKHAKAFHFGGVALLGEESAITLMHLLKIASQNQTWISFDPNIRIDLIRNKEAIFARLKEALRFVHILKMGADDWVHFFENREPAHSLNENLSIVILTEGSKGVHLFTRKMDLVVPSEQVVAVDTTGAGDAFMAAFLSKIVETPPNSLDAMSEPQLREWASFANHWAGKIIQYPGAVTAYFI
jgi:fructokinase